MLNWTHIMVHHSLTKDGKTVSWDNIEDYHKNTRHWNDIGYHFGIELVDGKYVVMVGRPLTEPGAHCKGMNQKAIGICCVGNFDLEEPPEKMLRVLVHRIISPMMHFFNIPLKNVVFHRAYAQKTCPGRKFTMDQLEFEILVHDR